MTMPDTPETFDLSSHDIAEDKRQALLQLFPEARTEGGKLDFDRLKLALGEAVDVGRERYGMNWPGKAECFKAVQQPSQAALIPSKEESVNFDTTENLIIEGDNLEVLKLLQKSYLGKVKMIYIDPPYNTGNDFIYPDNYSESLQTYLEYTGQVDASGKPFGNNLDSDGRFHSKWLSMMYPRLFLSRNLLTDDGVACVSIGERELSNLLVLCCDIFGEENIVTVCSRVMKTGGQKGLHFSPCVDYVIVIAKDIGKLSGFRDEVGQNVIEKVYTKIATEGPRAGEKYRSMGLYQAMLDRRANQRYYIKCPDGELVIPPGRTFPDIKTEGAQVSPEEGDGVWRWTFPRYSKESAVQNVEFIRSDRTSLVKPDGTKASWNVYYRIWLNDRLEDGQLPGNILDKFESRHSSAELKELEIPFEFAKPSSLIKFLMSVCGSSDSGFVLDFFAGSGTTAHAVLDLNKQDGGNRKFILVQLPEPTGRADYPTIADITKERVRRVIKNLNDEDAAKQPSLLDAPTAKQDRGFRVFKLAESNFTPWNADVPQNVEALQKQLFDHVNHIRGGRTQDDILYELLLKSGFPLTTPVEVLTLDDKTVYSVAGGVMLLCLERVLTLSLIRAMADLKPERVVCLDEGFAGNDQLKTNAVQIFKTKGVTKFQTV